MAHIYENEAIQPELERLQQPSLNAAQDLFWKLLQCAFYALVAFGVILFETHIVYSIFEFISGEDDPIWQPQVMALASLILVLGVHFAAHQNPDNKLVRMINRTASIMIPIYLLGIVLLIIVTLYNSGLMDFLSSASGDTGLDWDFDALSSEEEAIETDAVSAFITNHLLPFASLFFAFGIGSLAVISVSVAHYALTKAETLFAFISKTYIAKRLDEQDLTAFNEGKKRHSQLQTHIDDAMMMDDTAITEALADEALNAIQRGLAPTLAFVSKQSMTQHPKGLTVASPVDVQALSKAIKPIQAITRDDIIKILTA